MTASESADSEFPPATPPPSPIMPSSSESPESTRTKRFSRRQWVFATVFGVVHFASATCISLQAPFYPEEAESKGVIPSEYGLVFGVFELASFISSPFFGKYLTQLGPVFTYNAGIFVAASCSFLFGLLDLVEKKEDFLILSFAVRIVEALGAAASVTASFTIIATEFPETVATTFATLETFFGLGLIAGPTIGGVLYQVGGYKTPFMVMGGVLISAALITFVILPDVDHRNGRKKDLKNTSDTNDRTLIEGHIQPNKDGILSALAIPFIFLDILSISASSMSIGFLSATLEPHLRQFNLSPSAVGAVFVVSGGMYAASAPIIGRLCDRGYVSTGVAICIGHILVAASFLAIGPAPFFTTIPTIFWLSICGLVIHGTGGGLILVPAFVNAMASAMSGGFPEGVSTYAVVSGLWASSFALGAFLGPSIGGVLFDLVGFRMGSMVLVAIHLLCVFVHAFYRCLLELKLRRRRALFEQRLLSSTDLPHSCLLLSPQKCNSYGSISTTLI